MLQIEPHPQIDTQQKHQRKWSGRDYLFSRSQLAPPVSQCCFLVLSWLYPISFPWFLWIEGYHKEMTLESEWTKDRRPSEEQSCSNCIKQHTGVGAWQSWGHSSQNWEFSVRGTRQSQADLSLCPAPVQLLQCISIFKKYFNIFILPCSKNDLSPAIIWLITTRTLSLTKLYSDSFESLFLTKPPFSLLSPVLEKNPDKPVYQESPHP